jgi:hypothetical protein
VLKPAVGADGIGVTVAADFAELCAHIAAAPASGGGGWLVQPLVRSIRTTGETSIVIAVPRAAAGRPLDLADIRVLGKFAKLPARPSIMVQERLGGSTRLVAGPGAAAASVTPEELAIVLGSLATVPGELPVLARVDILDATGEGLGLRLSELELIEPSVYGELDGEICTALAQAVHERISN